MSIAGNLKTMEFAELLQFLARGRKTGTLVIDNGRVEKRVIFDKGTVISSASSDPKEYLGHFLVSHGYITEAELVEAMELQRSRGTLLGKLLVTIGVMAEEELEQMLILKAEESVYDVFSWPEAEFNFLDGQVPASPMVRVALDVTRLVLKGIQRQDEWGRIREAIPSPLGVPVALAAFAPPPDEGTRRILERVNDDRSIEEIALQTHASEFHVCKVLFDQMQQGLLKVVRPRALPGAGVNGHGEAGVDVAALVRGAEKHLAGHDLAAALRHLQAARSLEPDNRTVQKSVQALEVRIQQEIRAAGIEMAAVVQPTRGPEELAQLDLSPQEGFILSRINGTYDVETVLKITPMPRLEAMVSLWRLLQRGHVRVEARR